MWVTPQIEEGLPRPPGISFDACRLRGVCANPPSIRRSSRVSQVSPKGSYLTRSGQKSRSSCQPPFLIFFCFSPCGIIAYSKFKPGVNLKC